MEAIKKLQCTTTYVANEDGDIVEYLLQPLSPSFSNFASLPPLPDDAASPPPVPLSPLCTPKKRRIALLSLSLDSPSHKRLRSSSSSPICFLLNSSDYPAPPPTAEEFAAIVAADKKRWAAETQAELVAFRAGAGKLRHRVNSSSYKAPVMAAKEKRIAGKVVEKAAKTAQKEEEKEKKRVAAAIVREAKAEKEERQEKRRGGEKNRKSKMS